MFTTHLNSQAQLIKRAKKADSISTMFKRRWLLEPSANRDKAYLSPSSLNKIEQKNTNYKGFRQSSLSTVWESLIMAEEMALCVEQILSHHFHLGMKQCEWLLSEPRHYPSACGKQAETSPSLNTRETALSVQT